MWWGKTVDHVFVLYVNPCQNLHLNLSSQDSIYFRTWETLIAGIKLIIWVGFLLWWWQVYSHAFLTYLTAVILLNIVSITLFLNWKRCEILFQRAVFFFTFWVNGGSVIELWKQKTFWNRSFYIFALIILVQVDTSVCKAIFHYLVLWGEISQFFLLVFLECPSVTDEALSQLQNS